MPKITYVIPCYNMEQWLPVAVESCLYQSDPDIEVLIINDGSTDKSGVIADHYALQDQRVRVIHQSNRGLGASRQVGQEHARGEFITWLDADDFLGRDATKDMYGVAVRDKVDVVCGNAVVFSSKTFNTRKYFYHKGASGLSFKNPDYWKSKTVWRWIFKVDFLNSHSIHHYPYKYGQDVCFMFDVLTRVDSFSQCASFFYYFRQEHKGSHMTMDTLVEHQLGHFKAARDILIDAGAIKPLVKYLQENFFRDTKKIATRLPDEDAKWGVRWLEIGLDVFEGLKPELFSSAFLQPEVRCDRSFVPLATALCTRNKEEALSLLNSYIPAPSLIGNAFKQNKANWFHTWRRRVKAQIKPLSLRTRFTLRYLEKAATQRLASLDTNRTA